ncbi:hypothetical protein BOTBODRAFT_175304 [Botryobasidium botryosum FD-172 SS1]|uniref:Xylanolytic transcriptional activator regulatory domain-containing protein n=1 Tax=Botryobasidium botryosum (strain FD-172 SS1) TaxID=930990 RepID=A0A067MPW0_BOTB1|nr:hypothetical protein BOTBODRAFT_175304 [Botryobasidium botryosum FD-172 SS1]
MSTTLAPQPPPSPSAMSSTAAPDRVVKKTRRRQRKCDRQQPCGLCVSRNVSHLCRWESGPVSRPPPARPPPNATSAPSDDPAAATIQALTTRLAQLERAFTQNGKPKVEPIQLDRHLSSMSPSPPPFGSPAAQSSEETHVPTLPLQRDVNDAAITLARLSLAHHGEYLGSGSIVCALYKLGHPGDIALPFAKSTDATSSQPSGNSQYPSNTMPQSPLSLSLRALVAGLPPRATCDTHISNFFEYRNWRFAMPKAWFLTVYDRMWRTLALGINGVDQINPHWLTLLFSMFALAGTNSDDMNPNGEQQQRKQQYFLHALAARRLAEDILCTSFLPPSQSSTSDGTALGCLGAVFISCYMCDRGNLSEAWKVVGSAMRGAIAVGLHRDPGWTKWKVMSCEEQTLRKTTWWLLFIFDRFYSYVLGRSAMLSEGGSDVPLPRTTFPDGTINMDGTFQALTGTLGDIVGKAGERCHALCSAPYATVLEMDRRFEEWEANLPTQFSWRKVDTSYDAYHPNLPLQRATLAIWYLACRMNLHRPFLTEATPPVLPPPPGLGPPSEKVVLNPSFEKCVDLAIDLMRVQREARTALPMGQLLCFTFTFFVFDGAVTLFGALSQIPTHPRAAECLQEVESACEMLESARAAGTGEIANQAVSVLGMLRRIAESRRPGGAGAGAGASPARSGSGSGQQTPSTNPPTTPLLAMSSVGTPDTMTSSSSPSSSSASSSLASFQANSGHAYNHSYSPGMPQDGVSSSSMQAAAPAPAGPLIPFLASPPRPFDAAGSPYGAKYAHFQTTEMHMYGGPVHHSSQQRMAPSSISPNPGAAYCGPGMVHGADGSPVGGGSGNGSGNGNGVGVGGGGAGGMYLDFGLMAYEMLQGVDGSDAARKGDWARSFMIDAAQV